MRFSIQFEQHKIPEWASNYIRYTFLLAIIKPLYSPATDSVLDVSDPLSNVDFPLKTLLKSSTVRGSRIMLMSINGYGEEELLDQDDPKGVWIDLLRKDCGKVSSFCDQKCKEFSLELDDIIEYVCRNLQEIDTLLLLSDHFDPRVRLPSLERAIQSCHRNFWNLEVYLDVNELALRRLLHKLKKITSDTEFADQMSHFNILFSDRQQKLRQIRRRIYAFAAEQITHTDMKKTKQFFRRAEIFYKTTDIHVIAFCHGVFLVCIATGVLSITNLESPSQVIPSFCIYRLIACFMFLLWVACAVLYVFDYYSINWLSVLEVKRRTAISFIKLMKTASVWTALWGIMFMCHAVFMVRGDQAKADIVSFVSFLSFLSIWLIPIHLMYLNVRKELLWVLFNIFISPFGKVEFVHFFTADVLTSLAKPIADVYRGFCFITSSAWIENQSGKCSNQAYWLYLLSVIPYFWRFCECWNRFYYTRKWFPHLVNMGKYTTGIVSVSISFFFVTSDSVALFVLVYLSATLYMFTWDLLMDFGFRRFFTVQGRKQRMYPQFFYYYISISNLPLRLTWVLTLMPESMLINSYMQVEMLLLVASLLEILRRGQWTILRVENEKFSNIEKYRQVDFVPKMPKIILDE